MKLLQSLVLVGLFATLQVNSVDIPNLWKSGCQKLEKYGQNLLHDGATQGITLGVVATTAVGYWYYQYQSALQCLDGHPNSQIMYSSNLIHITYSEFLAKIAVIESYGQTLDFIYSYCSPCYAVSQSKINKFVALCNDLQLKNSKRADSAADQENVILENFKTNLLTAQANMKQEAIDALINTEKNKNNAVVAQVGLNFFKAFFGSK